MSHNYVSIPRYLQYLNKKRIVYRRNPITDKPTLTFEQGRFYEDGTYECYDLFRSKAKITTYKSLKWHLLVLWYLNPKLDVDKFTALAETIANYKYGFIAFDIPAELLNPTLSKPRNTGSPSAESSEPIVTNESYTKSIPNGASSILSCGPSAPY